jgi:hypothetical protein
MPVMWGLDFDGFRSEETLMANVERRFGAKDYFDLVFLLGVARNHEVKALSEHSAVMIREHECWGRRCDSYVHWNNATIVLFAFAQDMIQYDYLAGGRVLAQSVTAAHRDYFYRHHCHLRHQSFFFMEIYSFTQTE